MDALAGGARSNEILAEIEALERGHPEQLGQHAQLIRGEVQGCEPRHVVELERGEPIAFEPELGQLLEAREVIAHIAQLIVGQIELAQRVRPQLEQRAEAR